MKQTKGYAKNNYETLRNQISSIQSMCYGVYGYRRMTAALNEKGYHVNHKLVRRLMKEEGLLCKCRNKSKSVVLSRFNTYAESFGKKGNDLLKRDFSADYFGVKWATDMTKISFDEKEVYLAIVIDLFNSEVVGYSLSDKPTLAGALQAINYAHMKHDDVHPILHSDRGWFYCTDSYIGLLKRYGYRRSMSETGSCYDNAVAESFFAQIKAEMVYPKTWSTVSELKKEIHKYINFYNNNRIKKELGYKSPVDYRIGAAS